MASRTVISVAIERVAIERRLEACLIERGVRFHCMRMLFFIGMASNTLCDTYTIIKQEDPRKNTHTSIGSAGKCCPRKTDRINLSHKISSPHKMGTAPRRQMKLRHHKQRKELTARGCLIDRRAVNIVANGLQGDVPPDALPLGVGRK